MTFSRLREHFGTAGLVVAVVALVAALGGAAVAATAGSDNGKATASAKAKQGKQGKRGKTGPAGPVGPAGPAGAPGAAGARGLDGANGTNGTNGAPGAAGKSVTNTEFAGAEGTCTEGGTKLVGTATTYACNGKKGVNGSNGSPWTAGGTLPPAETETGTWSFNSKANSAGIAVPLSFSLPLEAPLDMAHVHFIQANGKEQIFRVTPSFEEVEEEIVQPACPGTPANPAAGAGHLCVYTGDLSAGAKFNTVFLEFEGGESNSGFVNPATGQPGAATAGTSMEFFAFNETELLEGRGTWAVTAAE